MIAYLGIDVAAWGVQALLAQSEHKITATREAHREAGGPFPVRSTWRRPPQRCGEMSGPGSAGRLAVRPNLREGIRCEHPCRRKHDFELSDILTFTARPERFKVFVIL